MTVPRAAALPRARIGGKPAIEVLFAADAATPTEAGFLAMGVRQPLDIGGSASRRRRAAGDVRDARTRASREHHQATGDRQ
jgi:hypothetical protein